MPYGNQISKRLYDFIEDRREFHRDGFFDLSEVDFYEGPMWALELKIKATSNMEGIEHATSVIE